MTFQDLYNNVFRLMRDPNQTRYSLTYVKEWLNEAERQYCLKTGYSIKKDTNTTTVATTREYDIPTDFIQVIDVYYSGDRLAPIEKTETIHSSGDENGTPTAFYVESKKIGLEPIPTAADTLTIIYYSMGGAMSADADDPIIPKEHHMMLAYYAAYHCCIEGDDTRLTFFYGLWDDGVKKAVSDVVQKSAWPEALDRGYEVSSHDHAIGGAF